MKKVFVCLLLFGFLISMVSCDSLSTNKNNVCNHNWINATCTEPKKCSKCGETSGSELGHTTTTGICSRCGKNFCSWEIGEFVDEFNQPTGEKFIATSVHGTFSNSATTNSELYAAVQVTSFEISIMLWEYGNSLVKGTYSTNKYNITVLDSAGEKHYFTSYMSKGDTRINLYATYKDQLLALLKESGSLSFYVVEDSKYSMSSYLFTIQTDGFESLYSQIK